MPAWLGEQPQPFRVARLALCSARFSAEPVQEAFRAVVLDGEYENLDERHKLVLATKLLHVLRERDTALQVVGETG